MASRIRYLNVEATISLLRWSCHCDIAPFSADRSPAGLQPNTNQPTRGISYRARIAAGEERLNYLRATDDATYGVYAAYARKTAREIPVVILEPATK